VDWRPFDHPQLGTVEIGGWDGAYAFRNPPPPLLEAEIAPLADWAIWHAGTGPRLELRDLQQERVGDSVRLRLTVQNSGWLPTHVTKTALKNKICRGVIGEISCADVPEQEPLQKPAWLHSGQRRLAAQRPAAGARPATGRLVRHPQQRLWLARRRDRRPAHL